MKLVDMINSAHILDSVAHQKMPAKVAYAIGKNLTRMEPDLKGYEMAKNALLDKYGHANKGIGQYEFFRRDETGEILKDAEGNSIVDIEAQDALNKEHKELIEMEVELIPYKIPLAYLEDPNHPISFTPAEMIALDWLIEDENG